MQMFYCDDKLLDLENKKDFKGLINYLETEVPFSEENFSAQIAYSWYLYCEGDFITQQVSEDWEFYKRKWVEKIDLTMNKYLNYPKICLIAAYSLAISGMEINNFFNYEKVYKTFYELSKKKAKDKSLLNLIIFLSSNRNVELDKGVVEKLFPNDTLIDKYFSEVLTINISYRLKRGRY